jgi:predicted O-linked N-acetylglucosamine transferase (SPINDLY family)
VAYLSADFRRHATAYLLAELVERHDRARFEIIGVSFGPDDKSDMRARLVAAFDRFVDVAPCRDEEVARFISRSRVDIAVDLMGHTQHARPGILAFRPAPIQTSYLGFPGLGRSGDMPCSRARSPPCAAASWAAGRPG